MRNNQNVYHRKLTQKRPHFDGENYPFIDKQKRARIRQFLWLEY